MFERFSERARQVIVLAQEESRALNHNYIGTEHILLGLGREEEGLAARVLESLDISVERVRAEVVRIVGRGDEAPAGAMPFTPRAKKLLELAMREAMSLGHNLIGTEHILLGLLDDTEGVAARILLEFDADPVKVRREALRMVPGPDENPPLEPQPRVAALPHRSRGAFDYPIHITLAPQLRRLMMIAAARALEVGRTETELRDLMLALVQDEEAGALLSQLGVDETSVRKAINAADAHDEPPAASAES